MPSNPKRPILYKGEVYSHTIEKRGNGPRKEPGTSYGEARNRVLADIQATRKIMNQVPKTARLPDEFVVCIRLSPEFSAKSYYPGTLFNNVQVTEVEEVGSRIWRKNNKDAESGKLYFVRATEKGLNNLEARLKEPEEALPKSFKLDIRKIDSINTLTPGEQILGIPEDWESGRLEAVLHPFRSNKTDVIKHFFQLLENNGLDTSQIRYKQYEEGITFVSLPGDKNTLKVLSGYNPLRALHPISLRAVPVFNRGSSLPGAPMPPEFTHKPDVTVGIFDGGINESNPCLKQYCESVDSTTVPADQDGIDHGTQVAGAILYGPLNSLGEKDKLSEPLVRVKSFRVLPLHNPHPDLYEIIDTIEAEVPKNKNIKVYNLSLGPSGPILDDQISRFTFACDRLSVRENILFTVAVGNDGHRTPYDRIQSPSDMVNGLGIGAYTKRDGKIQRAPYSCIGPGREGNKLKPDLVAFGGCDQTPIHLLSNSVGHKNWNQGTSFAAPLAARVASQLIGYSNGSIDPLIARAMLVHTSHVPEGTGIHNNQLGHGVLEEDVKEIVSCVTNSYTLIYQGELIPGQFAEFKVPWIKDISPGKIKFKWTTAVYTPVDPYSPDDYTSSSIMTSFYPNSSKFLFSDPKTNSTKRVDTKEDPGLAQELLGKGWEMAAFPISESGPPPFSTEEELRANMKWDTIDSRTITKMGAGIREPVFHIHALTRGKRNTTQKIKYALVLSVELADTGIDLYSKVINQYSALAPITLRTEIESQIQA